MRRVGRGRLAALPIAAIGGGTAPAAAQSVVWPRWFWPLFAVGIVVNLLPLVVAPILPFNDLHGAAGLLGAWVRRPNPEARIDDYFTFNVHLAPNVIYWAVGWALTRLFSVTVATNLYIGLFCVVGLPVSLLVAVRALGKDPVLSFLAFPLIYHRCLWYGFMGSVPAVALLLLVIGFASLAYAQPHFSWRDLALAATMLVMATAHAFLYLVTLGLMLLWALLAMRQPSSWRRRLAALLPSLLYLGPWLAATFFGAGGARHGGGEDGLLLYLWRQRPAFSHYLRSVRDWLIDGYAGPIDDAVALVFAATLLAFLLVGIRPPRPFSAAAAPEPRPARGRPAGDQSADKWWTARVPITTALLTAGYFLLPMSISRPHPWWAVHVRLLVPALLVGVLLVPVRRRGLPRVALVPVMVAAIFYGGYLTADFRFWWTNVELNGFSAALAAIPPGQRVQALYPPYENERHYSHFPMGYIVDYYIVDRGGTAAPILAGPNALWVAWRPQGPGPGWGFASAFNWAQHGRSWDYFLAKQPAPGNGPQLTFFSDAPTGAIRKVFEQGLWSVWRREM
ncbi:MAG: hypothetical protein ABJA82_11745 [Myxococcales bacterium]